MSNDAQPNSASNDVGYVVAKRMKEIFNEAERAPPLPSIDRELVYSIYHIVDIQPVSIQAAAAMPEQEQETPQLSCCQKLCLCWCFLY